MYITVVAFMLSIVVKSIENEPVNGIDGLLLSQQHETTVMNNCFCLPI